MSVAIKSMEEVGSVHDLNMTHSAWVTQTTEEAAALTDINARECMSPHSQQAQRRSLATKQIGPCLWRATKTTLWATLLPQAKRQTQLKAEQMKGLKRWRSTNRKTSPASMRAESVMEGTEDRLKPSLDVHKWKLTIWKGKEDDAHLKVIQGSSQAETFGRTPFGGTDPSHPPKPGRLTTTTQRHKHYWHFCQHLKVYSFILQTRLFPLGVNGLKPIPSWMKPVHRMAKYENISFLFLTP